MACFAFKQNKRDKWECKAITAKCAGRDVDCLFYKSIEKHLADKKAANERIATLPDWQQTAISEKHYDGKMPWRVHA